MSTPPSSTCFESLNNVIRRGAFKLTSYADNLIAKLCRPFVIHIGGSLSHICLKMSEHGLNLTARQLREFFDHGFNAVHLAGSTLCFCSLTRGGIKNAIFALTLVYVFSGLINKL